MTRRGNKTSLVVVESPAKARTISRFLDKGYVVKASLGHVRDLPEKELGVQIDASFSPKYAIIKGKRSLVNDLKKISGEMSSIYLATDPDREGEAISWHLFEAAGWDKHDVKRVVFHEITQHAIGEAFRHPRDIDMRLVHAQQARRILDRLVGYQLSPLLWKKVQRGLSAGRVQSVTLRLVVDRDEDIQAFVPAEFWTIEATLSQEGHRNESFVAALHKSKKEKQKLLIKDEKQARHILETLEGARYQVASVTQKETRRRPAPPFITSTLQQEAWRKLRFSAKQTMFIAQKLYEGLSIEATGHEGLITYMRTDSTHVASSALHETQSYIREKFGDKYTPRTPRHYTKKSKGAQEAHEAIRPTSIRWEPDALRPHLSSEQHKLYDLIWKRTVASQMTDCLYDSTKVVIDALQMSASTYQFQATGTVPRFLGFQVLYREGQDDVDNESSKDALPDLENGEPLNCLSLKPSQHFTQPPARYTEATLVKALEERGIGRPSTYAPTISTIQDRGYVTKDRGRFKATRLGQVVSEQLTTHFPDIMNLDFTAQMEEHLDEIAQGKREWVPLLQEFYEPFSKALSLASQNMVRIPVEEHSDEVCEKCSHPMVVKTGRFGRFLSCSDFPECRNSKPLLQKTGVQCPRCSGELVQRRGKGRTFYGCANYPSCDFSVRQRPLKEPCPQCGDLLTAYGQQGKCTKCSFKGIVQDADPLEIGV